MSLAEKITTDIPHPFRGRRSVTMLNPEAFVHIEGKYEYGEGVYEELTWEEDGSNLSPNCDVGPAVSIHSGNLFLCKDQYAYIIVLPDQLRAYVYPKTDFTLIKKNIPSPSELRQKSRPPHYHSQE